MKTIQKHKIDGTYRPKRHKNKMVTETLNTPPKPPADLPKGARKIWEAEAAELHKLRTMSEKDLPAFRELVMNVYFMQQAEKDLEKNGMVLTANLKAGQKPVSNPSWRQFQDAQKIVIALRKEFGVTPLSGQRFEVPELNDQPDPFADFFKGILSR